MSVQYENILLVKQKEAENVVSELNKNNYARNVQLVFKDDKYAVITFDSRGDIFEYDYEGYDVPQFYYEVYENVCLDYPEDGVNVECIKKSILNDRISNLITNKIIFKEIDDNKRLKILHDLQYTSELA